MAEEWRLAEVQMVEQEPCEGLRVRDTEIEGAGKLNHSTKFTLISWLIDCGYSFLTMGLYILRGNVLTHLWNREARTSAD